MNSAPKHSAAAYSPSVEILATKNHLTPLRLPRGLVQKSVAIFLPRPASVSTFPISRGSLSPSPPQTPTHSDRCRLHAACSCLWVSSAEHRTHKRISLLDCVILHPEMLEAGGPLLGSDWNFQQSPSGTAAPAAPSSSLIHSPRTPPPPSAPATSTPEISAHTAPLHPAHSAQSSGQSPAVPVSNRSSQSRVCRATPTPLYTQVYTLTKNRQSPAFSSETTAPSSPSPPYTPAATPGSPSAPPSARPTLPSPSASLPVPYRS